MSKKIVYTSFILTTLFHSFDFGNCLKCFQCDAIYDGKHCFPFNVSLTKSITCDEFKLQEPQCVSYKEALKEKNLTNFVRKCLADSDRDWCEKYFQMRKESEEGYQMFECHLCHEDYCNAAKTLKLSENYTSSIPIFALIIFNQSFL